MDLLYLERRIQIQKMAQITEKANRKKLKKVLMNSSQHFESF